MLEAPLKYRILKGIGLKTWPPRSPNSFDEVYRLEERMESTSNILTIREIAEILRCSKGHVQNVLVGKVHGVPRLAHLNMGRRKVVRKEWLDQWMEANKTR